MTDLTGVTHHPVIDEIVNVLCNKTQNTDKGFFRAEVAYFLGKMASIMRATIVTKDRGEIPVNIYALALATSGFGKGHSVNIMEHEFLSGFKRRFMEDTMPAVAEKHLWDIANHRAVKNGTNDPQTEFDKVNTEFNRAGAYPFTFDSGTAPAVKQLRHKLLLANCGAINLQIDEIGSNLVKEVEVLNLFLELYDQGMTKQKLTKNTSDSVRSEEIDGKTPTNMLLFGTPAKLLDGGVTENEFNSFLETGYARRCFFGIGHQDRKAFHSMTAAEIYARQIQPTNSAVVDKWQNHFAKLADAAMYGWKMHVEDDVAIALLEYKIECEMKADAMKDHEEIRKAEMGHRFFKALKLAGALAFVDMSNEVEMDHLKQAILLAEESGVAFGSILNREKPYVKLAKFIADVGHEVTHADLHEALPFYKSGAAARNELMTLATAWGHRNHIIIKKSYVDNIEFFKGESLKETNLEELSLSYSTSFAYEYDPATVAFSQLEDLAVMDNNGDAMHWANHAFMKRHRSEESTIPGFNMIVIDVDGGTKLTTVHELLKDYKFMTYTTKRHGEDGEDRFRLIIPINYCLELSSEEYKEFMNAVAEWLPFPTDESANQRSKKWLTNPNAVCHTNAEGILLDALPFIPRTARNEQHRKEMKEVASLDNLERWFAGRIATGNRNNNMIKFALALVDGGLDLLTVQKQVISFNKKLSNPLPEEELESTIMRTVARQYSQQP